MDCRGKYCTNDNSEPDSNKIICATAANNDSMLDIEDVIYYIYIPYHSTGIHPRNFFFKYHDLLNFLNVKASIILIL